MLFFCLIWIAFASGMSGSDSQLLTKIVGGSPALPNEFPYQVSLKASKTKKHFCGGTLITKRHVVTAAHCMILKGQIKKPEDYLVYIGDILLNGSGEHKRVERVIIHPRFSSATLDNDIGILKLSSDISPTNAVKTIDIRTERSASNNEICIVSGWGETEENNQVASNELMKVEVPIVDQDLCNAAYDGTITENMICAGYFGGDKDSCRGDSGGPLVCGGLLAGVISFGSDPKKPRKPGVYSDVAQLGNWIRATINGASVISEITLYQTILAIIAMQFILYKSWHTMY